MPKKSVQELQVLQNEKIEPLEEDDDSVDVIQAPKEKPKRTKTDAQMRAFEIARQKKLMNDAIRKEQRAIEREHEKKQIEEKIVKKAISIKKKQIKKELVLDDISDDETPIEVIKQIVKTKKPAATTKQLPQEQPKPKYYFV